MAGMVEEKVMGKVVDMTGQHFGRLTVIEESLERTAAGLAKWICQCSCGNNSVVSGACLRKGNTKSCGCLRKFRPGLPNNAGTNPDNNYEHGLSLDDYLEKL